MTAVFTLPLPTGLSSHDVDFNAKGDRAYSAALTQTLILDTTDPAKPSITTTILDPAISLSHGADLSPDETRLYVTDEQAGAAANGVCNVGGVRIVDITSRIGKPADLATFTAVDADTWSAKQYKNPKYLYANDLARGFDVFEYVEGKGAVDTRTPKQIQFGITRVGSTTFMDGAWCADPSGSLALLEGHHLS